MSYEDLNQETAFAPEVIKIDSENRDDFDFEDSEEDYTDAAFFSVLPAGSYVARITGHDVPSAISIPNVNNGKPVPKVRTVNANIIYSVKTSKPMDRKMPTSCYLFTDNGKSIPFGRGQLMSAYAAIYTALHAEDLGVTSAKFKAAYADNLKGFVEGKLSQVELRKESEGVLLLVTIKVRPERTGKNAAGETVTYSASNEIEWGKSGLVPESVLEAIHSEEY